MRAFRDLTAPQKWLAPLIISLAVVNQAARVYGGRAMIGHTITQTHRGLRKFSAEDGIFTLRVALPM